MATLLERFTCWIGMHTWHRSCFSADGDDIWIRTCSSCDRSEVWTGARWREVPDEEEER